MTPKYEGLKIQCVIFFPNYGIYLGKDGDGVHHWSQVNPGALQSAPTWERTSGEVHEVVKGLARILHYNPHRFQLYQVFPDTPGNRASIEACANATLPRWTPTSEQQRQNYGASSDSDNDAE